MSARYALAVASLAFLVQPAAAQQFDNGSLYAGPRIWIGNLNGALAVGGQIEKALTVPGDVGPGIIGGGVGIDFYSYGSDFTGGRWSYSVVPVQAFGNYHFVIEKNRKVDPYVGLALVYGVVSSTWEGSGASFGSASANYTVFAGQGGIRYFMSERVSLQGQIGFGYGTLGVGATLKL